MEYHRAVNTIEKLGAEGLLQFTQQVFLHSLIRLLPGFGLITARRKTNGGALPDELSAHIAGHDNDAIAEINPASLGIGQVTIIKYLEQ